MWFFNWYRPRSLLPAQAALGVQAVIGHETEGGTVSRDDYKAACRAAVPPLPYLLSVPADDATLKAEAADPFCIGWDLQDEPNDAAPTVTPVPVLAAAYARCKAVARPDQVVMLNLDGWSIQWNDAKADYDVNGAIACCDWVFFDDYVVNRGDGAANIASTTHGVITRIRKAMRPGQKIGACLEVDNQDLSKQGWAANGTSPTATNIQTYFDQYVADGLDAVCLFQDVIGVGFEAYDGPDDAPGTVNYSTVQANIKRLVTPLPWPLAQSAPITPPPVAPVQSPVQSTPTPTPAPAVPTAPVARQPITVTVSEPGYQSATVTLHPLPPAPATPQHPPVADGRVVSHATQAARNAPAAPAK